MSTHAENTPDLVPEEEVDVLDREPADRFRALGAVGDAGGVAAVDEMLVGKDLLHGADDQLGRPRLPGRHLPLEPDGGGIAQRADQRAELQGLRERQARAPLPA